MNLSSYVPTFPSAKPLELSDTRWYQEYTAAFPPYSDYNFESLWSYDTRQLVELSQLNGNLVVKFPDYLSNVLFLSFLGEDQVENTAEQLLSYSIANNLAPYLQLVPETVINSITSPETKLVFEADRDNFDYILDIVGLSTLSGKKYERKRNMANRFLRSFEKEWECHLLDLASSTTQESLRTLFHVWEERMHRSKDETIREYEAVERCFLSTEHVNLHCIGLFVRDHLVAFGIAEMLHDGYVMMHFEKADIAYEGAYECLNMQHAKLLSQRGYRYLNYEQDLGIEGLRRTKTLYSPITYLKKYRIEWKT